MEKGKLFNKHYHSENRLSSMLLIGALITVLFVSSQVSPSAFSVQPPVHNTGVDLDITDTITPVGTVYNTALIFHGAMSLGYDTAHNMPRKPAPMNMTFNVHGQYKSGTKVALIVTYALKRNTRQSSGETAYPCVNMTILGLGESFSDTFFWYEDGVNQVVKCDNAQEAQEGTSHRGTIYDVGFEAYPVNAQDIVPANNYVFYMHWNASRLVGDCQPNSMVDLFDALIIVNHFTDTSANRNWNAEADLKPDGIIDVYDAILLAANICYPPEHVP